MNNRHQAKKRVRKTGIHRHLAGLSRETKVSCDGCGLKEPWIVSSQDRYGFALRLAVCPRCLLMAQVDRFTDEAASRFYDGFYRPLVSAFHGYRVTSENVLAQSRRRVSEIAFVLDPFRAELDGGRWIDIGGGTGGSIRGLMELGYRPGSVAVVDPAGSELKLAESEDCQVFQATAEDGRLWATGDHDVLLCLQTLDHLLALEPTFRNFNHALREGGLAALTVADYLLCPLPVVGSPRGLDLQVDHTFYFTRHTLETIATRWGFRVARFGLTRPGHLAVVLRKLQSVDEPLGIDHLPRPATETAERALRLALSPLCTEPVLTLRSRLYRVKRWLQRRFIERRGVIKLK